MIGYNCYWESHRELSDRWHMLKRIVNSIVWSFCVGISFEMERYESLVSGEELQESRKKRGTNRNGKKEEKKTMKGNEMTNWKELRYQEQAKARSKENKRTRWKFVRGRGAESVLGKKKNKISPLKVCTKMFSLFVCSVLRG